MGSRMKEYRYYLSSGVSTSISLKVSLLELAPAIGLSVVDDQLSALKLTPPAKPPRPQSKTQNGLASSSSKRTPSAFESHGLEQLAGTVSELRNSTIKEFFISAQIFSDGLPLHPMVISSKGPTKCSESSIYWNEWLSFPVRYRDLSRNSQLAITIWGVGWVPIGGTTISFFTKHGVLRDGIQCLRIWPGVEADSSPGTSTPSEIDDEWQSQECFRLDKLREKFERKEISRNEWMDGVTDRRIARIRRGSEPPGRKETLGPFCSYREDALLWIEMPYFGDVVVYEEEPYAQRAVPASYSADIPRRMNQYGGGLVSPSNAPPSSFIDAHTLSGTYDLSNAPTPSSSSSSSSSYSYNSSRELSSLITVWDPELNEENPSERKYRKLARDILRGSIDPNLKPSRDENVRIEALLATPTNTLKNDDKDLLWKFRYTLTDNKKAVVKFLLSVDWNEETERQQATDLLHQWCEIDIADALKLLGREKEFKHEIVRNFAVSTLDKAKNEDLFDFLLQLVQALRYEKSASLPVVQTSSRGGAPLVNEDGSEVNGGRTSYDSLGPLARFLIERSSTSFQMANYFFWYLKVEAGDISRDSEIFRVVLSKLLDNLKQGGEDKRPIYDMIQAQRDFMDQLLAIHNRAREEKGKKGPKEEKLRQLLKHQFQWPKGHVIRIPLDPDVFLSGIVPSSAKMFKSAMYPAVIQFQTIIPPPEQQQQQQQLPPFHGNAPNLGDSLLAPENRQGSGALSQSMVFGASSSDNLVRGSISTRVINYLSREREGPMYKVMVKNGDDLRQDQLIMQMFTLMDRLLKKVNLDLKLTPYRILATGANDGLMEFVQDSYPVSYVVDKFETPQVLGFLRKHQPDQSAEYGVNPEALSTYVKSVAGYCVLTYLLGIGDRHLDNLMMKTEGNLFHIDFGYIFGADPKPYPPPFRLTKEMVEGMGGVQSQHYLKFQTYCCQAFNWLRKSADLILNLLSLMADAGIEELSSDPETTLQKVQEKFRLDLTDEQAEQYFLGLITDSVTALFPVLMEYIHKVANRFK